MSCLDVPLPDVKTDFLLEVISRVACRSPTRILKLDFAVAETQFVYGAKTQ